MLSELFPTLTALAGSSASPPVPEPPPTPSLGELLHLDDQLGRERAAARRRLDRLPPPPARDGWAATLPEVGGAAVLDDISSLRAASDPHAA